MDIIDLDKARADRAAAREGKGIDGGIRLGGKIIATLPVELPIDVLEPLRNIDQSLTLLIREAMQARQAQTAEAAWDAGQMIVDLLAMTPTLPSDVLDVISTALARLLGEEGLAALKAERLTAPDIGVLAKGIFEFYGVTLGEASTSPASSENDGATLSSTSPDGSDSTPDASTDTETTPTSLEHAAS